MFRHTMMLLVTTVLGSLADHEFFKGRRSNYNSNANNNDIYGGYDNGPERDMDRIRDRGYGDKVYEVMLGKQRPGSSSQDSYDLGFSEAKYNSKGYVRSGLEKEFIPIDDDRFRGIGEFCDENPNVVGKRNPYYRDDEDREDSKRIRGYRPYGDDRILNNANSNANNNAIGMKYRRVSWKPMNLPTYDLSNWGKHDAKTNPNPNANEVGGRRSNINSNVNTNDLNQYGGRGRARAPERRDRYPPYTGNGVGERSYGSVENNKPWGYPKKSVAGNPSVYPSYPDQEEEGEEEDPSGYGSSPLQSDGNVNFNSNTNIIGRRSNTNANRNSNVFSRARRSITDRSIDRKMDRTRHPGVVVNGVAEIGGKNLAVAENWESARGAVYRGLE